MLRQDICYEAIPSRKLRRLGYKGGKVMGKRGVSV